MQRGISPDKDSILTEADRSAVRCASFVDGMAIPLTDSDDRKLGPCVVALTPWRHNILYFHQSPYVMGTAANRSQLIQALWILSPHYRLGSNFRYFIFSLRWIFLSRIRANTALSVWIRAQFIDMPSSEVDPHAEPDDSADPRWLAGFVLSMVSLGWAESAVLHAPYSRLLQYLAVADERAAGANKPRFNRKKDAIKQAYLIAKRAKRAAAEAATP